MKIISNLLEDIDGIRIYYIIGLLIFVTLFIVISIKTWKMPKQDAEKIKNSILNDNDTDKIDD
jgi:L-cystine uptake protein TcyP (sodium:dicarboxylate symporter family)